MNQENKFGEIREKLLHYWAVFLAACGKFWEYVKVNGKMLLQKLASWLLKAKDWLKKTAGDLAVKGKAAWEQFSVWLAGVGEKVRPMALQARDWCTATVARLKSKPAVEALPAAEEPEALPAVQEPAALPEVAPQPAEEIVPAVEPETEAAPEKVEEPAAETGNPYVKKVLAILAAVGRGIKLVIKWIWKLRRIFMAIPVIWYAVKFAMDNMDRLSEKVGLDIQSTGEFARMITREEAVYWPLGITMFCLLLMFCSKKPVLPWVISIFTLVLPWLIWILNYYA